MTRNELIDLNSNIEIHKLLRNKPVTDSSPNLNSNIEIHKLNEEKTRNEKTEHI